MSLNSIINTSLSGLFTNQQSLNVTSNNIANVNTPGYSRLRVDQSANILQGDAAGVKIDGVTRVVDTFLETAHRTATSNSNEHTASREFQDRIQGILGDPNSSSSMSSRMTEIYSSLADLSLNPADVLRRQQTMNDMQSFLDNTSLVQDQIQSLRADASEQIKEKITDVNAHLERIYNLNPLITKATIDGNNAGALEGQMSQTLDALSELIDIQVTRNDNGSYRVATSSGVTLVDKSTKSEFDYDAPGTVSAGTFFDSVKLYRLNPDTDDRISEGRDMNGQIRSGRIRGLLDVRDEQLVNLSKSLGEMSAEFADTMNAIHNSFTASPAPNELAGKSTFVDGSQSVNFTGQVTFAVTDSDSRLVASHSVNFDSTNFADYDALITSVNAGLGGAGTLSLTDGSMTLTATNSDNGVVVSDNETNPSDLGGRGFSHYFGMNDMVTADQSGIYETGLTGADPHTLTAGGSMEFRVLDRNNAEITTVSVPVSGTTIDDMITELNDVTGMGGYVNFSLNGNGELSWEANSVYKGATIQIITDTTQMGTSPLSFAEAFGIGDEYRINAAKDIQVKSNLIDAPAQLSLSRFEATTIGAVAMTGGDQRGALALQKTETDLQNFNDAGELKATQASLQQYLSQFLGNAGLMARRAENQEADNTALQMELMQRKGDVTGVNLDEELSNLIVYQNAYNASARVLSSVQELYDTLLNSL